MTRLKQKTPTRKPQFSMEAILLLIRLSKMSEDQIKHMISMVNKNSREYLGGV